MLGPEFGGSIGLIFTAANVMDCALNVVGFAQTVIDMMKEYGGIVLLDGGDNDIRIIGTITMVLIIIYAINLVVISIDTSGGCP